MPRYYLRITFFVKSYKDLRFEEEAAYRQQNDFLASNAVNQTKLYSTNSTRY